MISFRRYCAQKTTHDIQTARELYENKINISLYILSSDTNLKPIPLNNLC